MAKPLCFVLMPLGKKPTASGKIIDFDAIYDDLIEPAIKAAELEPLRADKEMAGGIIHKPMFERLILCEYAIADLTTANANVFYELGLRHAMRPASTVLLFAKDTSQLSFDVASLRSIPYEISADGKPGNIAAMTSVLAERLHEARKHLTGSPLYQLVDAYPGIQRLKTDVFRDQVRYSEQIKKRLADARRQNLDAVRAVEQELGQQAKIADTESGVVIDLLLSYRAVKGWQEMIDLVPKMSLPLAATVMVQEQLGLALNRANRGDEAESVLLDLIARRGPSSETYSILGRTYKDRWETAAKASETLLARGLIKKAIEAYLKGFEADWRDAYPGINAVTLMELSEPPDARREKILPVVVYAVERRIAAGKPDYWDYATRLELAVLAKDKDAAFSALTDALTVVRESWEPETTARNLRLINIAREKRGESIGWMKEIEEALTRIFHKFT
jgi:tetratricopeptide (TPR) repeat protein